MKAILCQSFTHGQLTYADVTVPEPAADEVLIKVHYCGVNFPDTLIIKGKYQFKPALPFSPGQEVSGIVEQIGDSIKHVKVGDRVLASMTWGGMAEYAVAKPQNIYKLPVELGMQSAACMLETYATAFHALKDRAGLKAGEHLVVLGAAGGTGTAAVQLGRLFGAKVTAVASTEEKRKFAMSKGASEALSPEVDDIKSRLKAAGGTNVIFDPVGGELAETTFRTLNPGGRHLVVGFASGQIPSIPFNLPLLKSAAIVGVFWGGFWRNFPKENRRNVALLLKWFSEKKLDVGITKTYSLSEAARAINDLTSREVIGKIVLKTKNAD